LTFSDIILLVLVLGASSLGVSEVCGLKSTNLAFSNTVVVTLLVLALLTTLEVKLSQSSVTLGSVVGIVGLGKRVGTSSFVGESGEFFLFLLLLKSSLLLLSFFEGLFLGTLELGFTDGLLDVLTSEVHLGDVHDEVGQDKEDQRTHESDSSSDLNVKLRGSIGEDENSNNQGGVEGLIGEDVGVVARSLVGLARHNVEDVSVRTHEDEHVLQEDEGVLNGEGQE